MARRLKMPRSIRVQSAAATHIIEVTPAVRRLIQLASLDIEQRLTAPEFLDPLGPSMPTDLTPQQQMFLAAVGVFATNRTGKIIPGGLLLVQIVESARGPRGYSFKTQCFAPNE